MNADQDRVFALLADPATHGGAAVKRIDTHAAAVFLAGARAYKVKRAVRFPFLDYSTLDRREAACRAELQVNRPFAPDLYLGVVAVTREPDGALALKGEGEPVEWAVEMRRFDEGRTLDRWADAHGIDDKLALQLADRVAAMHAKAGPADAARWIAALGDYLDQNRDAFGQAPDLFPPDAAQALDRAARAALDRVTPLLRERGRLGLIRRGHGDLHLGNMVLLDEGPSPFDALEFDETVASGDLFYDLAFLLMDLLERGLDRAANIVLNRYVAQARRASDDDALAALPLFLALRASIRAKVTAARLADADAAKRERIAQAARGYFDLAVRAIAPPAPQLVAVGGLSGTGKSTLAREIAPHLPPVPGALLVRTDVERKRLFGVPDTERLPPDAYTAAVTAEVYARALERAGRIAAAGHSAVVDAVFAKPDEREAAAATARANGAAFRGLFLVAGLGTRLDRIGARVHDASDADAAVARRQEQYEIGGLDWSEVDASGDLDATRERALQALAGR